MVSAKKKIEQGKDWEDCQLKMHSTKNKGKQT